MEDLLRRVKQLDDWTSEMQMPSVVWLGGLFNPGSFITAVKQSTARRNEWPLDRVATTTEVTSSQMEEIEGPAPEGVYVTGLTLEGARIDERTKRLEDPHPKEMAFEMPVVQVKAVKEESAPKKNVYQCPVYRTERRFREEVFTAQLKTNTDQNKWVLQGVAIILDIAPK
jgi:dynein heavy chain